MTPLDNNHSDMPAFSTMSASGAGAEQAQALVDRLVERRRQLQLSQEQLAEKMGTHQPAIARLETGKAGSRQLANVLDYAAAVDMVIEAYPTELKRRPGRPRRSRVR